MNLLLWGAGDLTSFESGLLKRATSTGTIKEISGIVNPGETMFHIFRKYGIRLDQLVGIRQAALHVYRLKDIIGGHRYTIILESDYSVRTLQYRIDDGRILRIARAGAEFRAWIRPDGTNGGPAISPMP